MCNMRERIQPKREPGKTHQNSFTKRTKLILSVWGLLHDCFSTISQRGDNFQDFLFAFLEDKAL